MFSHNLWLKVPLLFAVVGHAELFEALTERRQPWWQVGMVLMIGSVVVPLIGEWIADDATTRRWRRAGWSVAASGALVHLSLDAACLALPWIGGAEWKLGLVGALVGGLIMTILFRRYRSALRDPEGFPAPPWAPSGEGWPARLWRGASQLGGNALAVMVIGLGFALVAGAVLVRRPEARLDSRLWLALLFFGACALVGLWMGLERRAAILGLPAPFARPGRRRRRRTTYVVTRDGLVFVDRKGAALYRWDALAAVGRGAVFNNPAVCVDLAPEASPERIEGAHPARWLAREARARAVCRALHGADLAILSAFTESGPGPLLAQLVEALSDPGRRQALPSTEQEIRRLRD